MAYNGRNNGVSHSHTSDRSQRIKEDVIEALRRALDSINLVEDEDTAASSASPSTFQLLKAATRASSPLLHLASNPSFHALIQHKNVSVLAGQLSKKDVNAVWIMPGDMGTAIHGAAETQQEEGKRKTVALLMVLLSHMTSAQAADIPQRLSGLVSADWEDSCKRVYKDFDAKKLGTLFNKIMAGAPRDDELFKYVQVAAFVILARLLA